MPNSRCRLRIRSRICAWTVTSSAVVGSSAIRTFGRPASAMAIITRWRMPPESSCGYCFSRRSGIRDPNRDERLKRGLARSPASHRTMRADRLDELPFDRHDRVQRGHRLLEDHRDIAAAHAPHGGFGQRRKFPAGKRNRARHDARHVARQEPHDGERRHRLAGAGFAGDAEGLAGGKIEGEVLDDDARAFRGRDFGRQIADGEKRRRRSLPPCGGEALSSFTRKPRAENRTKRPSSADRRSR